MEKPENFEITGGCARFAPKCRFTIDEAAAVVSHAIMFCQEQRIPKLFVDATRLPGFPPELLTTIERYWLAQDWAERGRGAVAVAMVTRPQYIDPEKFGVMVANNAGLQIDVFTSELEALEFLKKARQEA